MISVCRSLCHRLPLSSHLFFFSHRTLMCCSLFLPFLLQRVTSYHELCASKKGGGVSPFIPRLWTTHTPLLRYTAALRIFFSLFSKHFSVIYPSNRLLHSFPCSSVFSFLLRESKRLRWKVLRRKMFRHEMDLLLHPLAVTGERLKAGADSRRRLLLAGLFVLDLHSGAWARVE